jgi:quercetin dioxygenase-like cupin family protein
METIKNIENGRLYTINTTEDNNNKQWNAHPAFKGVYLKHLITGTETNGQFSAHIVKVEPGCILDTHIHAGKTEIHEVIVGTA